MIPVESLQAAIRSALLTDATISAHIAPDRIRTGHIRAGQVPAIILGQIRSEIMGHAAGGQIIAEAGLMLHVLTAPEDEQADLVAGAACRAMMDAPPVEGLAIDAWERPAMTWTLGPDETRQAAIRLQVSIRWID